MPKTTKAKLKTPTIIQKHVNVNLIFSKTKTVDFTKGFEVMDGAPEIFRTLNIEPGRYSYGPITSSEIDTDGDRLIVPDEVLRQLVQPPYNKVYIGHQQNQIPAGVIKFAGRVPEFENPIMIEKLNEGHPDVENIWKSQIEGALDAYSISGKADSEKVWNDDLQDYEIVRRVTLLVEVSKVGTPANRDAMVHGLFIAKSGKDVTLFGGNKMSEEYVKKDDLVAFKKEMLDDVNKAIKDSFESFKKEAEPEKPADEESEEEPKEEEASAEEPAKEGEPKPEPTTEPEAEPDVQKMVKTEVDKQLSELKKSLVTDKAVPKEPVKKKVQNNDNFEQVLTGKKTSLYS